VAVAACLGLAFGAGGPSGEGGMLIWPLFGTTNQLLAGLTLLLDAALTGIAQGLSTLPGLSRSGLTVSALLARQVDRREALVLSFLLSIPASLGAGLYSAYDGEIYTSGSAIVAVVVAVIMRMYVLHDRLTLHGIGMAQLLHRSPAEPSP